MPNRRCLTCGAITTNGTRCTTCTTKRTRQRNDRRTHYQGDWKTTRARVKADWIEAHGQVCPGWQRPPHQALDLTVDHVTARSRTGGLTVLCTSCNASKGAS